MTEATRLSTEEFKTAVSLTPLVAIDLLVRNSAGELLVGERVNPPAKGFLFAPGGRIRKNERLADAFMRLTKAELGQAFRLEDAVFQGLYDHLYEEDFTGAADVGSHYIVLAHTLEVDQSNLVLPADQHSKFRWISDREALSDLTVHEYTKAYCR